MCYAIPAKVLEMVGDDAVVDYGGVKKRVNVRLVEDLALGDFVLVHAGFAIERLDQRSAEQALEEIRNYLEADADRVKVTDRNTDRRTGRNLQNGRKSLEGRQESGQGARADASAGSAARPERRGGR